MNDEEQRTRESKSGRRPWHRRPGIVAVLVFGLIAVAVGGTLYLRHAAAYEQTDDAYIDVAAEYVAAQVSGRVLRVLVKDNQDVKAGQDLVDLDPAEYLNRLEQARASVQQGRAQLAEAEAQKAVYRAQAAEAQAGMGTAEADATNADDQLERYRRLKAENAGAVSAELWDRAVAAQRTAAARLKAAQKAVSAAEAQLQYADSLGQVAQAAIAGARAQLDRTGLDLSYTHVKARLDGRIAAKTVAEGNVVAVGAPLMDVVPREVYVTANFKETQLTRMRPGQPVSISVDAYPDMNLRGHVDSIQPAAGQALSLLPPENATGNWVKVVQRIPVKIVFDHLPDDPVRCLSPGMSVEVSVRLH